MRFRFEVEVEVERSEGKFASREELSAQLLEALEAADPSQIEGDNGGVYEVVGFDVEEVEQPKRRRR